jgi:glutathione S-transferase
MSGYKYKLHGHPQSSCTLRAMVVLQEKGLEYELVPVDVYGGEHKTPQYLEKHPFGKIPYLVR